MTKVIQNRKSGGIGSSETFKKEWSVDCAIPPLFCVKIEVIEVSNSNRALNAIDILKYYLSVFASSNSRAISPFTSENATSFRPLFVTTSA